MQQRSIAHSITLTGIGLHCGRNCTVALHPLVSNSGIQLSIKGGEANRISPEHIVESQLCTTLLFQGHFLSTVEHLLAAIGGLGIDNILISTNDDEVPILDGSSKNWVEALKKVGIIEQPTPKSAPPTSSSMSIERGQSRLKYCPAHSFSITASIEFSHPMINDGPFHYKHSQHSFLNLSSARTFGFLRDQHSLNSAGLALGASKSNCLIFTEAGLFEEQKLHRATEALEHKILDFIGDITLLNRPLSGEYIIHRPSHSLTQDFLKRVHEKEKLTPSKNRIY